MSHHLTEPAQQQSRLDSTPLLALGLPMLVLVLMLGGCSKSERVSTNTVLANSNCKGVTDSIKLVTLAEVARYRGTQLLQESDSEQHNPSQDLAAQSGEGGDQPLFVALSRGVQPTRGFELHLANQAFVVEPNKLEIPVFWTTPDPQKSHPLVNTNPCLVVSVPNSGWQQIAAVDQDGNPVGSLEL